MPRRPLQVLMISSIFYPKINGTVIAVSNLLVTLKKHGCAVRLITHKLSGTMPAGRWQNIPIIRVGPSKKSPISRLILSLNQIRAGIELVKKEEIDVIHAHGSHSLFAGIILGKLFRRPVIITFHGFQRLWFKDVRWKPEWSLALTYPISKFLINNSNAVIAQSKTLKKVISNLYDVEPKKIHVIPNAIDEERFEFVSSPSTPEQIVLFVGSLTRVHGTDLLVKAAPTVLKVVPDAKFVIVGQGPQKESLNQLVKRLNLQNHVFLVGSISDRDKLAKEYASAKVVVVPLKYEGYIPSLVVLEAMSTGRPIITTMILDPELYNYGIRKSNFNPTELARAIVDVLLLNKEEYSALTNLARTYFIKQCSKEVIASQIEGLYSQMVKKS